MEKQTELTFTKREAPRWPSGRRKVRKPRKGAK